MAVRGSLVRALAALCGVVVVFGTWCGSSWADGLSGSCSNEQRREEQNTTFLPDCRAYEMVSPLDKNGTNIFGAGVTVLGAANGERASYYAPVGFGETTGSGLAGLTQYVATRRPGEGWFSRGITPTPERESLQYLAGVTASQVFSEDLGQAVTIGVDLPAGRPDGIPGGENIYVEDTMTGALQPITTPLDEPIQAIESFGMGDDVVAASSDLEVVAFETRLNLLPGTEGSASKLYAWEHGKLTVAGVLPDGELPVRGARGPIPGAFVTRQNEMLGSVSRDGSSIVFQSPGEGDEPQLYLRRDGRSTAWVSQSESSTPDPEPQSVTFEGMTPDGSKVLFATTDKLLDSDPGGASYALYLYTDSPHPETESNLTFIARVNGDEQELVSGMSEDAERIYLSVGAAPGFSKEGLYLWEGGSVQLVAAMHGALSRETTGTSADGGTFAFLSSQELAGAALGASQSAMYVYDAQAEKLTCASCLPDGQPTSSSAQLNANATVPATGTPNLGEQARFLSSDGRYVFFSTADALVPEDTNGLPDAYAYDVDSGRVELLSTGTGEAGAWFAATDETGENAFILTSQRLVPRDTDNLVDVYDVRVDGGLPEPQPETGGCVGDECQGTPSAAPSFNTASGFSGFGNTPAVVREAVVKGKHKALTRAQQFARALRACKGKPKKQRPSCRARAQKRYGAKHSSKSTSRRTRR
jgi:hypothetical protein